MTKAKDLADIVTKIIMESSYGKMVSLWFNYAWNVPTHQS